MQGEYKKAIEMTLLIMSNGPCQLEGKHLVGNAAMTHVTLPV